MTEFFDLPSLQEDCIQAAELYLKYLTENKEAGKGMLRLKVLQIQGNLLDSSLVLVVDRKIRYAEEITLRVGGTVYENTETQVFFRVLSAEKRRIIISPVTELAEHMKRAMENREQIFAEIDLLFLVKRIRDWYEKRADTVRLPSRQPSCRLLPDNPITLSDNQYSCAEKAMSSPLCYIWGAPGTGKTKHVLASCIYSYVMSGKKVVLVAPTNNALEQSLNGLLWTLERAGISPDGKVLRMGYPSEGFKTVWPNVCEAGAYAWLKAQITEEIEQLKYENERITESLEIRAGKAKENTRDRYPGTDGQELNRRKERNRQRINELLNLSQRMTETKSVMPLIDRFNIVAATVDSCIHRLSPGGKYKPDHVFLDEAGYCCVIKGMTLTGFGCPLTMLGDHKQLPPVFDCDDTKLISNPATRIVKLWQESTLYLENALDSESRQALCRVEPDRPTFDHMATGALNETHRFGPALASVLAGRVYGKSFRSKCVNETRILYVNTPKKEEDKGKDDKGEYKRTSSTERRCIRAMMEHNLSHSGYTTGIISPYTKQTGPMAGSISRLMDKYERTEELDDDVITVHRSQGREWDVVLFSITDSFDEKWLTNSNRTDALKLINTAVSRAKKLLILVGDIDDWKDRSGQLISDLIRVAEEMDPDKYFNDYIDMPGEKEEDLYEKEF